MKWRKKCFISKQKIRWKTEYSEKKPPIAISLIPYKNIEFVQKRALSSTSSETWYFHIESSFEVGV